MSAENIRRRIRIWRGSLRSLIHSSDASRNALITVLGGFTVQATTAVSGVAVARLLGLEDRGHLALFWVVGLALSFVGAMGLPSAITYWVARDRTLGAPLARLISRVGVVQVIVAVLIQAVVLLIAVGDSENSVRLAALISLPAGPAMITVMHGMAFLQGFERFWSWTAMRILPMALYTFAVLLLAVTSHADLVSITAAWTLSYLVAAVAVVERVRATLPASNDRVRPPKLSTLARFGARAFLGSASPSDTLQLDQAFVGLLLSPASLGLYVVGLAFTNLPRMVSQSVGYVAYPHVARRSTARQARRAMWQWTGITLLLAGSLVAVLEATAGWLVPLFFGNAFAGAVDLARILLISALLVSVRRVLADAARGAGHPLLGTMAEVTSSIALLPAIAIFAGALGVTGVALAMVIASALGLGALVFGLAQGAHRRADQDAEVVTANGAVPDPALLGEAAR